MPVPRSLLQCFLVLTYLDDIKVGKLLRGVTVGHVERPGLVWVNAPPTEESDALLKKVRKKMMAFTISRIAFICNQGGNDELGEMATRRPTHGGNLGCSPFLGGWSHLQS